MRSWGDEPLWTVPPDLQEEMAAFDWVLLFAAFLFVAVMAAWAWPK